MLQTALLCCAVLCSAARALLCFCSLSCALLFSALLCRALLSALKILKTNAQFGAQNGSKTGPKQILEPIWRVEKSVQAAFGLLDASWNALGRVWAPKKLIGIGSRTARGHRGDRFQLAWGSKMGPREGSKKGLKTGPRLRTAKP